MSEVKVLWQVNPRHRCDLPPVEQHGDGTVVGCERCRLEWIVRAGDGQPRWVRASAERARLFKGVFVEGLALAAFLAAMLLAAGDLEGARLAAIFAWPAAGLRAVWRSLRFERRLDRVGTGR